MSRATQSVDAATTAPEAPPATDADDAAARIDAARERLRARIPPPSDDDPR